MASSLSRLSSLYAESDGVVWTGKNISCMHLVVSGAISDGVFFIIGWSEHGGLAARRAHGHAANENSI